GGIDRQIHQRQFQLGLVDAYRPCRVGNVDLQYDVDMQRAGQNIAERLDGTGRADDRRIERHDAREREQLPGQVLAARRRNLDRLQRTLVLRLGEAALEALRVTTHDHQQIVEVVGDSAR